MIGSGKLQSISSQSGTTYQVDISPSIVSANTANGAYTSPILTANVYNGVGPFTYDWRSPDVNFSDPTSNQTTFTLSGFNETVGGAVICVVLDEGNGDAEEIDNCILDITFS